MQIHMTSDSEEMVPHFYIEVYKIYSFSDKTNWSQNSKILEGDTNEHYQKYIVHYELLQVAKYFQSAWHSSNTRHLFTSYSRRKLCI